MASHAEMIEINLGIVFMHMYFRIKLWNLRNIRYGLSSLFS